jgi:hypothetical protein
VINIIMWFRYMGCYRILHVEVIDDGAVGTHPLHCLVAQTQATKVF